MPNHIHGIMFITDGRGTACRAQNDDGTFKGTACRAQNDDGTFKGTACRAPTERFGKPVAGSVPTIIRSYKSAVTKNINELRNTPGVPVWQRNYYERIIRDDRELDGIREYIVNNPAQWDQDTDNPKNSQNT